MMHTSGGYLGRHSDSNRSDNSSSGGNRRHRYGFTLLELMIVVAIIGVLAAIAIPSLQKSVRRSRTSEALIGLRKIFDGSVAYFDRDHTTPDGQIVDPQFPGFVAMTPGGAPPRGIKRDSQPTDWDHPTWRALTFGVSDPYYYVYQYDSGDVGNEAWFFGEAFGDLDGDQLLSRFRRGGTIRDEGIRGFGGIWRDNPTE